jgi:hypothetical protein
MQIILQIADDCDCKEATGVGAHNCRYRRLRDSLIPQAADFADLQFPLDQRGGRAWCRIFFRELDRLVQQTEDGSTEEVGGYGLPT